MSAPVRGCELGADGPDGSGKHPGIPVVLLPGQGRSGRDDGWSDSLRCLRSSGPQPYEKAVAWVSYLYERIERPKMRQIGCMDCTHRVELPRWESPRTRFLDYARNDRHGWGQVRQIGLGSPDGGGAVRRVDLSSGANRPLR